MDHIKSRFIFLGVVAAPYVIAGCAGSGSSAPPFSTGNFAQANLVGDTAAGSPAHVDPSLLNPWGISLSPNGPFWISDNHSGISSFYNGSGVLQGSVKIPDAGGGTAGPVSGQVFNGTNDFAIPAGGGKSLFIFSSEDGIINAWGPASGGVAV